jgi:hypothetical protein
MCDVTRKRSRDCFIPFFEMHVELFMRAYIELTLGHGALIVY